MPKKYTADQREAMDRVDAVLEFAEDNDWELARAGVLPERAWAEFVLKPDSGRLTVMYGVGDADDKFIFGKDVIPFEALRGVIEAGSLEAIGAVLMEHDIDTYADLVNKTGEYAVDDAAHSAAHTEGANAAHVGPDAMPPTMPPTGNAAHQEYDHAAHQQKLKADNAAHTAEHEYAAHLSAEDNRFIGEEARRHAAQAGETHSQQDILTAVRDQTIPGQQKNWSRVVSPLSSDEILEMVKGRHVYWRNNFSGTVDSTVVATDKASGKHAARITPEGYRPDFSAGDEDFRILHFLEPKGGFRAISVGRITKVG